jgi:hypothetical protein
MRYMEAGVSYSINFVLQTHIANGLQDNYSKLEFKYPHVTDEFYWEFEQHQFVVKKDKYDYFGTKITEYPLSNFTSESALNYPPPFSYINNLKNITYYNPVKNEYTIQFFDKPTNGSTNIPLMFDKYINAGKFTLVKVTDDYIPLIKGDGETIVPSYHNKTDCWVFKIYDIEENPTFGKTSCVLGFRILDILQDYFNSNDGCVLLTGDLEVTSTINRDAQATNSGNVEEYIFDGTISQSYSYYQNRPVVVNLPDSAYTIVGITNNTEDADTAVELYAGAIGVAGIEDNTEDSDTAVEEA